MHKTTPPTKFLFTLLFFFLSFIGFSQTQTFNDPTANGTGTNTFTVPAGVTSITVEVWGAGGRGAARNGGNNVALAGGGGGGYSRSVFAVTAGNSYTINVGAGSTSTAAGGDTWAGSAATIMAKGGGSVADNSNTSGTGGLASFGVGTFKFNGGNGAMGTGASFGGGGGSSAGTTAAGSFTNTTTNQRNGATAPTDGGNGGNGAASGVAGVAGVAPGGGGGGGYRAGNGSTQAPGDGADGQVIISWTVPCVTPPTTANAGSDQTLAACATTATLAGNTPVVGTGVWSVVSGTATITTPSSATSGITGLTVGASATLRWSITNGGCTVSTDDVIITTVAGPLCMTYCNPTFDSGVRPITNVTFAGINKTTSPNIDGPDLESFTDTATVTQGSVTNAISLKGNTNGNQTYNFRVYIDWDQNGTLGNNANEIYDIGTIVNSTGIDAKFVSGNIAVPATALIGSTKMRVMKRLNGYSSGPCQTGNGYGEAEDYIVDVIASGPPTITSLGATSGCVGGSITINGTNLTGATAAGVTIGGTAVSSITSNSGTILVAVIGVGTTGTVSVTTPGGTATITGFTVNQLPTANAGSALAAICKDNSTVALGGSVGGSATGGIWSSNVAGGTFANNTGTTPEATTWTPPTGYVGTVTFTLTTTGGTCGTTTATKTQVVQEPTANAGTVLATICQGGTTAALGGSFGGSATGATWSTTSGGTFNNNGGSTPNTATWTPPAGFTGTATLILTTTGGSCGTTTASKTQEVNIPPTTATVGSNQSVIGLVSNALGGNTPITGTGTWSRTSGPGSVSFSAINSGSSTATVTAYGTHVFRWTITNAPCTSSFAEITVVYTAPPAPEINVKGGTTTISDGDNSPSTSDFTDFGTTSIGVGITRTFTIENTGPGPLAVGAITFTGANSTDFSVSIAPNATVASTSSTTFTVTFTPSGTGTRDAVINIANDDSDENPYNFSIRGTGNTTLTKGPGGVITPLQLWLRADLLNGTTSIADNTAVSTWNTQAKGSNAIKPAAVGAPVYKNNATANINFNAVVDFTNNYTTAPQVYTDNDPTRQYLKGASGFYSRDIFAVVMPDVTMTSATASNDIFCGDRNSGTNETDGTGIGYGAYTNRFNDEVLTYAVGTTSGPGNGYGVAQIGTGISYSTAGIINASNNAANNGTNLSFNANALTTSVSDSGSFATVTNSQYWIGRSEGWDGSLDGRVAEIITLDTRATDAQRSNIQSYLAIKYGITLGVNGTSMNYTNSDGNTIWNRNTGIAANDVFNFDIAGIGRDDISKLNQKQSKSINTTDDITIGLTDIYTTNTANPNTFDTDKKFLVWGNNHGTLAAQPAVIVNISSGITSPSTLVSDVSFISVGRTWKVVETGGNIPTTKVSIPTTMLSATLTPPGDYLMFISSTPNFDPTAEYRVMKVNGANLETTYDFDGTKYITFGFAPEKTFVRCIKFDGTDDYLDAGKVLNLNTAFTVSAWVNRNSTNKTILSKRNSAFSEGYDLSINTAGKAEMSWMVGSTPHTITSSAVIPAGTWHHIGVIYDGTTAKMYIDGVTTVSASMPNVPSTTQSFLIAAADGVTPTALFNGSIDEVRVWDVALSEAQFRYVINQEIQKNGTLTNGSTIPGTITLNDISSIQWNKLSAYYPMSTYTYTNAKDISDNNFTAALRNLTTVDLQTAPLPYESAADGLWQTIGTWTNSSLQDLPYSFSIEDATKTIDWNIVKTTHNISSQGDKTVLGLYVGVATGSKLTATTTSGAQTDGSKIQVTHYLKLDGTIDLIGRSQLVQTEGSDLDTSSKGFIIRDQQGQANKYNYNYWSSPVGPVNDTSNNNPYTVDSILRDGTNPASPGPITWIGGYDGALSPFSLARYWIYKFDNLGNAYANWTAINETGFLDPGKGFTLKGAGVSGTQNLTFIGKPNNGTISNTVGSKQLLLTGNPYASAIDAIQFIHDNSTSITGTLYFWEHYQTNNSHNLAEYQGGYAVKNLSASVAPSSVGVLSISGNGSSLKNAPNQYIPVGQGFFVVGKDNGVGVQSSVTFRNSQRAFVKEDNPTGSQSLYRIPAKPKESAHWTSSSEESVEKDAYKRIRLGFNNYNQIFHRQVVLAFMEDKADSEFNDGYDAKNIDNVVNDMYLVNGTNKLIIEGEGYFNKEASYPIGVKNNTEGTVSFIIDGLENFDDNQVVFLYDDETKTYHDIRTEAYEVALPIGENKTRFSLRFTDKTLGIGEEEVTSNEIKVAYAQNSKVLTINNTILDAPVEKVTLYNINGQSTGTWEVDNQDQQNIQLTIKGYSTGVYIAKIKTSKGVVNKKIIIP